MAKNMASKKSNCATAENGTWAFVPMYLKYISFLWLLSQQFLQDCSLAASEVDLGEWEATALSSLIYWTYSVVTALSSLLVANKGTIYGADASERFLCTSTLHNLIARNNKGWISWQKLYLWALSLNRNYFLWQKWV